jgi:hypothetical protein
MSDTALWLLSAKRSLIGLLLGPRDLALSSYHRSPDKSLMQA